MDMEFLVLLNLFYIYIPLLCSTQAESAERAVENNTCISAKE